MPTIDLKPQVKACLDFYSNSPYSPFRSMLLRELDDDLILVVYAEDASDDDPDAYPELVIALCEMDGPGRLSRFDTKENGVFYLLPGNPYTERCLSFYGRCRIPFKDLDALPEIVLTPYRAACREYPDFLKLSQYMTLAKPVPKPADVEIDTLL